MDKSIILEWLHKIWNRRKGAIFHKPSILVWYSFQVHQMDAVKDKYRQLTTSVTVIPSGLTSMLKLLYICLNKLFKRNIEFNMDTLDVIQSRSSHKRSKYEDVETITQWFKV